MRRSDILAGVGLMPPGVVEKLAGSTIPSGWLFCDGQSVTTSAYPTLFAVIGYTYGGSGGSFNVPDLRGRFIRGLDNMGGPQGAAGIDSGRSLGSAQGDLFGIHSHPSPSSANNNSSTGPVSWAHTHAVRVIVDAVSGSQRFEKNSTGPQNTLTTNSPVSHSHPVGVNTSMSVSLGNNENSSETKPQNLAVKYIIKT